MLQGGLDPESVGDILTRIGDRAQLDIRPTGPSPRRGMVTESSRAGNPDALLERQGGWAPAPRSCAATARKTRPSRRTPCTACCRRPCPPLPGRYTGRHLPPAGRRAYPAVGGAENVMIAMSKGVALPRHIKLDRPTGSR